MTRLHCTACTICMQMTSCSWRRTGQSGCCRTFREPRLQIEAPASGDQGRVVTGCELAHIGRCCPTRLTRRAASPMPVCARLRGNRTKHSPNRSFPRKRESRASGSASETSLGPRFRGDERWRGFVWARRCAPLPTLRFRSFPSSAAKAEDRVTAGNPSRKWPSRAGPPVKPEDDVRVAARLRAA